MSGIGSHRTSYLVILHNPAGQSLTIRVTAVNPDDAAMRAEVATNHASLHGNQVLKGPWVALTALKISGTPS